MPTPTLNTLTGWDYGIIAFYAVFVSSIGLICRRLNTSSNSYFRGGGNMLWWVGGVSTLVTSISTWTFTGGAAKCYNDGFLYPLVGILVIFPSLALLWKIAPRFRRIRVITAMDAVFRRFGVGTEQFYTWFTLPMGLFWGGIGLNTLAVFMSSVFGMPLMSTIVVVGILVTVLAVIGGQWAVSFFAIIQGTILFSIVVLVACFSLNRSEIGGVSNLLNVLPARHTDFTAEASGVLVFLWVLYSVTNTSLNYLDLRNSAKYTRVKNDRHARMMVLMVYLPGFIFMLPILTQIPSLCAAVLYPDMRQLFPQLNNPEEGAWLAMAMTVLPQGVLGLMVCAMFGAAADSADAALNSNAGFFVRNVYLRWIRPDAPEVRQVVIAKIITALFGVITILTALMVNSLRTLNLYDLFQILNALLLPPMIAPMVLGIFFRRTPDWSGWSTVIAGMIGGLISKWLYSEQFIQGLLGLDRIMTAREIVDSQTLVISTVTWGISVAWFFSTMLVWKYTKASSRQRIEELFLDFKRPVDHIAEGGENQDATQYKIVGLLSMVMGIFLLICVAIPNQMQGRMCFLVIGGVLVAMGLAFKNAFRKQLRADLYVEIQKSV